MSDWISISAGDFEPLRQHVLSGADEEVAFAVASIVGAGDQTGLLLRQWQPVPAEQFTHRGPSSFAIDSAHVIPWLKRADRYGGTFVLVHGHRDGQVPTFSTADLLGEQRLFAGALGYFGDRPMAALLLTPDDAVGRLWWSGARSPTAVDRVKVVGRRLEMFHRAAIEMPAETHARQILAVGTEGQQRLRRARVAVVGAGGTGSLVIQLLAHLGVGSLLIIDPDVLERSNRSRVVGSTADDEGQPKAHIAARLVSRIDPDIEVTALTDDVRDCEVATRLVSADIIFGCTDSHSSRAILNRLAMAYLVPLIDLGVAVGRMADNQVSGVAAAVRPVVPGGRCLSCQDALDAERIEWENLSEAERGSRIRFGYGMNDVPQPSVITFNAVAAAHAVTIMQDMLTPFMADPAADETLLWVGGRGSVTINRHARRHGCSVCGDQGVLAAGPAAALGCRPRRLARVTS